MACVALNNVVTSRCERDVTSKFLSLVDAPTLGLDKAKAFGVDLLRNWNPTSLVYSATILTLGAFSLYGFIHDWTFWAIALSMVNFVVLGYSQATLQGPILRSRLAQVIVVGSLGRPDASPSPH